MGEGGGSDTIHDNQEYQIKIPPIPGSLTFEWKFFHENNLYAYRSSGFNFT
jgi:hypothetical protein